MWNSFAQDVTEMNTAKKNVLIGKKSEDVEACANWIG